MAQKYGHRANAVDTAQAFTCLICNVCPTIWTWSDLTGEAMCTQCGTPYQLLHYKKRDSKNIRIDKQPTINIKESWIPILRRYWDETKRFTGLGTIMNDRDYPECVAGCEALDEWLEVNPDALPVENDDASN